MNIEPAHVDQVIAGRDGRWHEISKDVGGVVAKLKEIDPGFGVRFNETGRYWHVYHRPDERTTRLLADGDGVLTVKAYQGVTGAWLGLDDRIVERVRRIAHASYDFPAEVEKQNQTALKARDERRQAVIGEASERAASELRRELGVKSRITVPRDV